MNMNPLCHQLYKVGKIGNINKEVITLLQKPNKVIQTNFPVKINNKTHHFKGFRVQHNNILGPYKGGIRFDKNVNINEVTNLASWMTLKCSLLDIPFGGGKGGVQFDLQSYNKEDTELIAKHYIKSIHKDIGSNHDIPAPDLGTNSMLIDVMLYEYNKLNKKQDYATFTGKSLTNYGSYFRKQSTGYGVGLVLNNYMKQTNMKFNSYILQGYGNVGRQLATYLHKNNPDMLCLAIGDHTGYIFNKNGINIDELNVFCDEGNDLVDFPNTDLISKDLFFALKTDVLIPAALEDQITVENAPNLKCKVIIEAANGPVSLEADTICKAKNIDVIPDILANSGGVLVSYFEWEQNKIKETWETSKLESKFYDKLNVISNEIFNNYLNNTNISLRDLCYIYSVKNIEQKYVNNNNNTVIIN